MHSVRYIDLHFVLINIIAIFILLHLVLIAIIVLAMKNSYFELLAKVTLSIDLRRRARLRKAS
jgi:thiosulfate reductase cytochrome b subunit